MNVHLLPHPAGQHSRHGVDALGDNVRRFLLWLLPSPMEWGSIPRRRDDWSAVARALGDVAEDFFSVVAILGLLGIGAMLMIGLLYLLPWWLVGAGLIVAGMVMLGVRLRQDVCRLEQKMSDEESRR